MLKKIKLTKAFEEIKEEIAKDKEYFDVFQKKISDSIEFYAQNKCLVNQSDQLSKGLRNAIMENLKENSNMKELIDYKGKEIQKRF